MSRGSEKGEKLWREYNMRLCKIITMTKFADEYEEFYWFWSLKGSNP